MKMTAFILALSFGAAAQAATPSAYPTSYPSAYPSGYPIPYPSAYPTSYPSSQPWPTPSAYPTSYPSAYPSTYPSGYPTSFPSAYPSAYPTSFPSGYPTPYPSTAPSSFPTDSCAALDPETTRAHSRQISFQENYRGRKFTTTVNGVRFSRPVSFQEYISLVKELTQTIDSVSSPRYAAVPFCGEKDFYSRLGCEGAYLNPDFELSSGNWKVTGVSFLLNAPSIGITREVLDIERIQLVEALSSSDYDSLLRTLSYWVSSVSTDRAELRICGSR